MNVILAVAMGIAAAAIIYALIRYLFKGAKLPVVIEVRGSGDSRTPSGIIELPGTFTEQECARFREAWAEAINHPAEMVILNREYGVRYEWPGGGTDDLPFSSRAEAEAAVADPDSPEATALLVRTVKQRMPERGPWCPEADVFTVNVTELLSSPVETPSDQDPEGETMSHE